ncbi:MAG: hypothetical protein CMP40_01060 [Rickettsiales bacterium]|nr:hypothetical protein [Rickettsiales bacterium]
MKNNKLSDFIKIRIQIGKSFYIGPGKVILLENIDTLGSISSAAKKLGMSYKKAWRLVKEINSASPNKIILTNTGGKGTGGAKISNEGKKFIDSFRNIENKVLIEANKEKKYLYKIFEKKTTEKEYD